MNCDRFKRMAALDLSGDLPRRAAARLRAHRADCPGCRAFAEELHASQRILHGYRFAVPSEDLMEQLRRNVLDEVERTGVRRPWWESMSVVFRRPAAGIAIGLAACGIAAVAIWLALPRPVLRGGAPGAEVGKTPGGEQLAGIHETAMPSTPGLTARQPAGSPGADIASGTHLPRAGSRRPARQPEAQMTGNGFRPAVPVLRRIELQTADPDIRIIWLVPASATAGLPAGPSGG